MEDQNQEIQRKRQKQFDAMIKVVIEAAADLEAAARDFGSDNEKMRKINEVGDTCR